MKIIALFNQKLKLGVRGRAQTLSLLRSHISKDDKTIWFHCASLGEYEQGLPVFEKLKDLYPEHKIILSFFSPSGFEIRKNAAIADVVVYLPLDTKSNARRFIELAHPELVIFVKYEIWPNYLLELKKRNVRSFLISALFRKDQTFFKRQGKWMLRSLNAFEHIFVQNESSKELLESHGFNNITISGDTRFDRVTNQLHLDNSLAFVDEFKGDKLCVVAGSSWPEDEKLLTAYINESNHDVKFILAPHNIKPHLIEHLKQAIKKPLVLFSEKDNYDSLSKFTVLIVDSIGLLSKVYSYADITYVGGAIGHTGLHNTLEPAVFGIPIIIGHNYKKFPEAEDMISNHGMFSVSNATELTQILDTLIIDGDLRKNTGLKNADYIKNNQGAVIQIIDFIRK